MKAIMVALVALTCAGLSSVVSAQTCASPSPLIAGSHVYSGDLCTATNSLPGYGGTPSPQKEVIYSFAAPAANGTVSIAANTFGGIVALMPSPCSSSTDIIAAGDSSTPMVVMGLVNGATYYLIVTADPSGPAAACGPYTITVAGFPVTLQSFSIE